MSVLNGTTRDTLALALAEYLAAALCPNTTPAQQAEAGIATLCASYWSESTLSSNATLPRAAICAIATRLNASGVNATLFTLLCSAPSVATNAPVLETIDAGVSGVVRAVTEMAGRVFAGGSFVGHRT